MANPRCWHGSLYLLKKHPNWNCLGGDYRFRLGRSWQREETEEVSWGTPAHGPSLIASLSSVPSAERWLSEAFHVLAWWHPDAQHRKCVASPLPHLTEFYMEIKHHSFFFFFFLFYYFSILSNITSSHSFPSYCLHC